MEYRYRDKAYLSNYMLDTKLFDKFDFLVEDASPVRSIYILNTNEGFKILKKVEYNTDTLNFIYNSLNAVRKKYPYIINFRLSTDGKPYVEYEGGIYVVLDLIEGRECVFENPIDLSMSAKGLARFHNAGLEIEFKNNVRNQLGRIIDKFKSRIEDMKKYKDIALMHVNKSEFDILYLQYTDYYISCANDALVHLESSCYNNLCQSIYTLCHHDLAHHNIIIGNDNNVYFIDFDYCIIDIPCHDICNMITRAIKHNGWNIEMAYNIIDAYTSERKISSEELNVLYGYLLFPQDFYDISSSYYMRTKNWEESEFVDKLIRRAGYKEEREYFLKNSRAYLCN
ncbi:CotS family spore coat protein [Caloramator sp. E03]|uniref:CotS family spore coat protein n=1 Tax=Caloramator sp. E03 TaxID=2576307 RepID=UPI001110E415|nr:CotS family spore coat protein [Caloramator sp. E03]QCX33432.1 CotS family spore coat protein [Caloramator sp. E03]